MPRIWHVVETTIDLLPMWQSWFSDVEDAEEYIRELKTVYKGHKIRISLVKREREDSSHAYLLKDQGPEGPE